MVETVGTAMARVTSGQGLPEQSTNAWATVDLSILDDLPDRLNNRQLAALVSIASLPPPPLIPVTEQHFNQCMRTMTILPSRDDDALTATLRLAVYRQHFGHFPTEAWSFLVKHATLECRFFPTPRECKEILDRWSRQDGPHRAHKLARLRMDQENQKRLDELINRFRMGQVTQDEVDQLPERYKRIAATQGYLRDDGTYHLRPLSRPSQPTVDK